MEPMIDEAHTRELYNICHDFKTPLSTIMGMAALSWSELEDREKVKDRLVRIEIASSYLLSMVNEILDYSKIVNGKMTIRRETFSLTKIIEFLEQILTPLFQKKHQTFEIMSVDIAHDRLVGDFQRLAQILINLLTNAMKYTGAGGEITLELTQIPESENSVFMEMKVRDTGIGMSEEFMKNMFEPYSCAENSAGFGRDSTGLGLSITKSLVTLMGGEIHAESKLREGTTMTVGIPFEVSGDQEIPLRGLDSALQRPILPNQGLFELKDYDFSGKCILIAEDNSDMLEITTTMLKPTGIRILTATNGLHALSAFRNSEPGSIDMILMDVRMPVMNGSEATVAIRGSGRPDSEDVAIVALTASDEDEENVRHSGMNAYIKKPVDYFYLLNLMDYYLIKNGLSIEKLHV